MYTGHALFFRFLFLLNVSSSKTKTVISSHQIYSSLVYNNIDCVINTEPFQSAADQRFKQTLNSSQLIQYSN